MDRVFDLAWRGAAARTPDRSEELVGPGAGLGLAIVKGIVEAHRGVVHVENVASPAGGTPSGCRFLVRLPAGAA
jgi:signal transduction histidine kinase